MSGGGVMQVGLALEGNLRGRMARDARDLDRAISGSVKAEVEALKRSHRAVVNARLGGGRGRGKVGNSVRSKMLEPSVGLVYSKFGRRQGGEFIDYLLPHVIGATIKPKQSEWLYISLEKGRKARRDKRRSVRLEKGLRFVPTKHPGRILLVKETRTKTTPIALLVRKVTIRATIDFKGAERRADSAIYRRAVEALEKLDRGVGS